MKIHGPVKTDFDVTLNRLRELPIPSEAKQTSCVHFGLDISSDMTEQAKNHVDRMIISSVENISLSDASVDVCICRQGLQFVNIPKALAEVNRVLKPGGRVVFTHLAAYNVNDRVDSFKIQALRNPARINFFAPGDLESSLEEINFKINDTHYYKSRESVQQWINHGASTEEEREAILKAYRESGAVFKKMHEVEFAKNDIFDTMLFLVIKAEKLS